MKIQFFLKKTVQFDLYPTEQDNELDHAGCKLLELGLDINFTTVISCSNTFDISIAT